MEEKETSSQNENSSTNVKAEKTDVIPKDKTPSPLSTNTSSWWGGFISQAKEKVKYLTNFSFEFTSPISVLFLLLFPQFTVSFGP